MADTTTPNRTAPAAIAFAWIIVGIPLLWGVWETVKKSAALFH
jgi:hypothetical protein